MSNGCTHCDSDEENRFGLCPDCAEEMRENAGIVEGSGNTDKEIYE